VIGWEPGVSENTTGERKGDPEQRKKKKNGTLRGGLPETKRAILPNSKNADTTKLPVKCHGK